MVLLSLAQIDLVGDWLSSYDPGSRKTLHCIVKQFLVYARVVIAELVERQKHAVGEDAYSVLKVVQSFVAQLPARRNCKRLVYSSLNQFFAFHHAYTYSPFFHRSRLTAWHPRHLIPTGITHRIIEPAYLSGISFRAL